MLKSLILASGGAAVLWQRPTIKDFFITQNYINILTKMSAFCAHFLFDIFLDFIWKDAFLCLLLTIFELQKSAYSDKLLYDFGPTWPEVRIFPHCRSPPPPFQFIHFKNWNGGKLNENHKSAELLSVLQYRYFY